MNQKLQARLKELYGATTPEEIEDAWKDFYRDTAQRDLEVHADFELIFEHFKTMR